MVTKQARSPSLPDVKYVLNELFTNALIHFYPNAKNIVIIHILVINVKLKVNSVKTNFS